MDRKNLITSSRTEARRRIGSNKMMDPINAKNQGKVVIIEDDASLLSSIMRAMKKVEGAILPAEPEVTISLDDAIRTIDTERPCVVICDKHFTGQGNEHIGLLNYIRANHPGTKVILYSSDLSTHDRLEAPLLFDGVIDKGDYERLRESVARFIERTGSREIEAPKEESDQVTVALVDSDAMVVRVLNAMLGKLDGISLMEGLPLVGSSDEVFDVARANKPDILIFPNDFRVESQAGAAIIEVLREELPDTKVVLLASSVKASRIGEEAAPFDAVVEKPDQRRELLNFVEILAGEVLAARDEAKKTRVLVLDADGLNVKLANQLAGEFQVSVCEARTTSDYEQAVDRIKKERPDVILVGMVDSGVGDHLRILDMVKWNYPQTKVVLFAQDCPMNRRRTEDFGFDGMIWIEPDPGKIRGELARFLKEKP